MPQFDFTTVHSQIILGQCGFIAIYLLFVTRGPFYEKAVRMYRELYKKHVFRQKTTTKEWRDRIKNGAVPQWWDNLSFVRSNQSPSYLEFFHALFLARKIKVFLNTRLLTLVTYRGYFKSLRLFIDWSNGLYQYVKSSAAVFSLFF